MREQAIELARGYFLRDDNSYGCAETCLMVLSQAYGLPRAEDSAPAMALNGGIAWSGGVCGAITGAAMATGRLAAERIADHEQAKRVARRITMALMAAFRQAFGDVNCQPLIGFDLATEEGHAAFVESQVWHTVCMEQIEFVIGRLVELQHRQVWDDTVRQLAEEEQPAGTATNPPEQGG